VTSEASVTGPQSLALCMEVLGHEFANTALLDEALTHASVREGRTEGCDNERLEFLGDRVLGLCVAEHLWRSDARADDQAMALRLNAVVSRETCARIARQLDLGRFVRLLKSEEHGGGREKATILGNACEAVIAAIYLDGGLEAARAFIHRAWGDSLMAAPHAPKSAKSQLQEWAASRNLGLPRYEVVSRDGPDHAPAFRVQVAVGKRVALGDGRSKQDAEREAAEALLTQVETEKRG
jgi:ribonuclease III